MALYRTRAIVLKRIDLSDSDRLVTFLSEQYGKIKCVAKSARRIKSRYGAALEPMTCSRLIYFARQNQTLYKLNSCDIIDSFQDLREDPERFYTAIYFVELMDTLLQEGGRGAEAFQLLHEALLRLESSGNPDTLLRVFELRLISILGYTPGLWHCMACRSEPRGEKIAFSWQRGGILCDPCRGREPGDIRFSAGTLNYLKKLLTLDIGNMGRLKIPKAAAEEIGGVTHRLVLAHVGRELKSYPFIKELGAGL